MATTPQTNTTLEAIAETLVRYSTFAIAGHVGPDGDCIGSQLALAHALRSLGKQVVCTLAADEPLDAGLASIPGAQDLVFAGNVEEAPQVFVAVDVPNPGRMKDYQWALHEKAQVTVTIDHHADPNCMAQLNYVDPASASTTMMVWRVAQLMGAATPAVAQCAYTGLLTDSGRFCNQNADVQAFQAAASMVEAGADPSAAAQAMYQSKSRASLALQGAVVDHMSFAADGAFVCSWLSLADFERCGAVKADADGMVDLLRSVEGVRVACMLRETADGVRGSLRAKDSTDVAAYARTHGGGGHTAAAGFSLEGTAEDAARQVTAEWVALLGGDE